VLRKVIVVGAVLCLGGCAELSVITQPSWSVYRVSRTDPHKPEDNPFKFKLDCWYCRQAAMGYRPPFDPLETGIDTVNGALSAPQSLPSALIGGAAGLSSDALTQAGGSPAAKRELYLDCLQYWTDKDLSAYVPKQK
jgi:hypothetical protein